MFSQLKRAFINDINLFLRFIVRNKVTDHEKK